MKTYSKRTVIIYPVWVHSKRTAEYYGNQYESGLPQKSVKVQKPIDTQKEIAKVAGVSHSLWKNFHKLKM
jgi:hypothetical protein